jgi:NhaP-type Na+/H+ or K+/H+ antiporter
VAVASHVAITIAIGVVLGFALWWLLRKVKKKEKGIL